MTAPSDGPHPPPSFLRTVGMVLSAFVALFAPWISPQNPFDIGALDLLDAKSPPGTVSSDGKITLFVSATNQPAGTTYPSELFRYDATTKTVATVVSAAMTFQRPSATLNPM